MVETAIQLTDGAVTGRELQPLLDLGNACSAFPARALPGVVGVLTELKRRGEPLLVLTRATFSTRKQAGPLGPGRFCPRRSCEREERSPPTGVSWPTRRAPRRICDDWQLAEIRYSAVARLGARAIHVPCHPVWIREVPAEALAGVAYPRGR
ncbi:MAG: hypothetical protein WKG07_11745 [Hymenobacter sp.]